MKRLGMGLVGPGFVAAHHIDAVRRLGDVDVVAIAGSSAESAARKAAALGVERSYGDYRALIADPAVDVVHNTTPNHMHLPVTLAALGAGKPVVSDKPLALNAEEGRRLRDAATTANVANIVTFNYRGNPMVQQARAMIAQGESGGVRFVRGFYLQDWMTDPRVHSWRSDPAKGGVSSALGDIGSHWCDLAEHVTGQKIVAVLADLATVVPMRYAAGASAEAFSGGAKREPAEERVPTAVTAEDAAHVLVHFANGAKGSFSVGQVLPGHKNDLELEVSGAKCSLRWRQEQQNELWIGRQERENGMLVKDPALLLPEARRYAHLPGGHQESWADAFTNLLRDAYGWIAAGGAIEDKPAMLPTFEDGYRSTCLVEAMLRSHAGGNVWENVTVVGSNEVAR